MPDATDRATESDRPTETNTAQSEPTPEATWAIMNNQHPLAVLGEFGQNLVVLSALNLTTYRF